MLSLATFTSLALVFAAHVHASIYVTNPVQASQCTGGQSCQVEWVDNGETPLLPQIGECNIALYTGEYQLVQSLSSVDVSSTSSFSFTPDPTVGADGQYYIVFSSTTTSYTGFSASFSLTGMTGTNPTGSSSTNPSATSSTTGSSTPPGSSSSTPTGSSSSTPSGTSTSGTDTTTPTVSPSSVGSSTNTGTTPTTSATTPTTSHTSTTTTSTTSSTSATPSNAAARVGSSTSLGGVAALLVLSGVLAF